MGDPMMCSVVLILSLLVLANGLDKAKIKQPATIAFERNEFLDCLVTNISVGTPPQNLNVEFQLLNGESDLFLYGDQAQLSEYVTNLQYAMHKRFGKQYYTSESSSYSNISSNVVRLSSFVGNGHMGQDDISANLLTQLTAQYENPIITIVKNKNQGHVMLGGLDEKSCRSNWAFARHIYGSYADPYELRASAISAVAANKTNLSTSKMSISFSVSKFRWNLQVGATVHEHFRIASDAVWNRTQFGYVIDCDKSKLGNVELTVGSNGSRIVLTPEDYLYYNSDYDACHLGVTVNGMPDKVNDIVAGSHFMDNHCLAYNSQTGELGFANRANIPGSAIKDGPPIQIFVKVIVNGTEYKYKAVPVD
ncbi:eukaryotic aspartyl protease domain-containing protein [Ditylenchus destructor]|uniref:Eukaryotic aspartyl protease domain-containing protein n=1 Tax=Ditylenchus destructor TaxID=166010 RepID=A0AAD4R2G2_9BILA|nr:eukaryotic aspartyl protease domain-containing protein [Ditylenchus destructor]